MQPQNPLMQALKDWTRLFMRQSMRDFVQFSREMGLSMPQISTLFHLRRMGKCGVSSIGDELGVTSAAASQMLDRLVQQGYLVRTEDPHDRRMKEIVLTPKGAAVIEASVQAQRKWTEGLVTLLTPEEQDLIVKALMVLTEATYRLEEESTQLQENG